VVDEPESITISALIAEAAIVVAEKISSCKGEQCRTLKLILNQATDCAARPDRSVIADIEELEVAALRVEQAERREHSRRRVMFAKSVSMLVSAAHAASQGHTRLAVRRCFQAVMRAEEAFWYVDGS